jgi:hypothetical protein
VRDIEEAGLARRYPAKVKALVDAADRIVGAQVVATRYGSQYSYGLLRAVLEHVQLAEFLAKWRLPMDAAAATTLLVTPEAASRPHPSLLP